MDGGDRSWGDRKVKVGWSETQETNGTLGEPESRLGVGWAGRDSSSWDMNVEKCVTDYSDGAMCAAEAPRGPGLVARME